MLNLVWLRSDLRIEDNPALSAALHEAGSSEHVPCVAVYHLCQQQWDAHGISVHKQSLIIRQLQSLAQSLAELNVPLKIINSTSFASVPSDLLEVCCRLGIKTVFFNIEYELNERKLSRAVCQTLAQSQISVQGFHDQCMIAPGDILNGSGEMYQVYTAFKNRYLENFDRQARNIFARPRSQDVCGVESELEALEEIHADHSLSELWPAGEAEAAQRLELFVREKITDYQARRDFPARAATSTLSPYLAIGALSVGQCFRSILDLNGGSLTSEEDGIRTWVNELIWREFYRHFLFAHPELCMHRAFKSDTERLPWHLESAEFEAWKAGKTGFPIVDAGMRQLNETGWMHNRLRMICAMFLTKHLFVDWRLGERYFMSQLIDGDFASNNGGWQWSASTGVDAAPYFRIFNPTRQSERFDASGEFIRRFVPELKTLDNRSIHAPKPEHCRALNYPEPIVDHRSAVERTKALFASLSGQALKNSESSTHSGQQEMTLSPLDTEPKVSNKRDASENGHVEKAV